MDEEDDHSFLEHVTFASIVLLVFSKIKVHIQNSSSKVSLINISTIIN